MMMMCAFEMLTQNNITTDEANRWLMANFGITIIEARPAHIMCAYTDITLQRNEQNGSNEGS